MLLFLSKRVAIPSSSLLTYVLAPSVFPQGNGRQAQAQAQGKRQAPAPAKCSGSWDPSAQLHRRVSLVFVCWFVFMGGGGGENASMWRPTTNTSDTQSGGGGMLEATPGGVRFSPSFRIMFTSFLSVEDTAFSVRMGRPIESLTRRSSLAKDTPESCNKLYGFPLLRICCVRGSAPKNSRPSANGRVSCQQQGVGAQMVRRRKLPKR